MSTVARSAEPRARRRRPPASSEVIAAGGIGALAIAALLSPAHIENGPVLCPFRRLTGLPCPGCGLTRSWVYLVHGDVHAALWANPFGPVTILAVLALAMATLLARVRHRPPPDLERLARRRPVLVVFAAWIAFGVARILVDLVR